MGVMDSGIISFESRAETMADWEDYFAHFSERDKLSEAIK
jgi:hypothetical protein